MRIGNYDVVFRPGYEVITPLTTRTERRYDKHGPPMYLQHYIARHRLYNGYIYLIHFKEPYKHAKHYLGFTRDPLNRELRHMAGRGARLMQVVSEADIDWKIVRLWYGDRYFERRLKNQHNSTRYCPVCNGEVAYDDVTYEGVIQWLNFQHNTITQSPKIFAKS